MNRTCLYRGENCDRTDIKARGLCNKHYVRIRYYRDFGGYTRSQPPDPTGYLTCQCDPPPFGDECPTCRRLILTLADDADRITYLRTRKAGMT